MNKLNEYKIAFRGLSTGTHTFNYDLSSTFFDCFEATKGTVGNVKAMVTLIKTSLLMEVKIEIDGVVDAVCDRCLGVVKLPIKGVMQMFVKQSDREEGNDDDYIVLAQDDDYLEMGEYIYETYMLNYPMRVVHNEGECDEGMQEVLDNYVIDEDNKPTDPRWDALKELINN